MRKGLDHRSEATKRKIAQLGKSEKNATFRDMEERTSFSFNFWNKKAKKLKLVQ